MYVVASADKVSHMLIDDTRVTGGHFTEVRQGESEVLDAVQMPGRHQVHIDRSRDVLLTDFGRATLSDRYLMPGEEFQDLFARVASYYGDDAGHAQRIYDYMSKLWFMPATPVLSNGGTQRGLPISCFLNEASDSLEGIVGLWNENVWLASKGGGIGSYWGNLRSIGEKVGAVGKTSGVIPFIRVMDSPDPGDLPGLAAPRLGRGLSAGLASRDRGVRRNPPPHRRRSESQGAEPAPRHPGLRRLHARGGGRRAMGAAVAEGRDAGRARSRRARCGSAS